LIVDLDAYLVYMSACRISWCLELFSPPLSKTLVNSHDGVLLLTNFSEFKLDHRFGCPLDKQACTPTFATFWAILTFFKPNPSELDDEVSLLSNFLELKYDNRFGWPSDRQAYTRTFTAFQIIFTPFNPNLSKIAQRSFTFDQFLRFKIWL